ncbi:hypothetical protein MBLNU13_g07721t1 [Cladosporium sp. NU13]
MGRMTRAKAAEVAERMHIDEDAVLDMSNIEEKIDPVTPEQTDRAVLGNIAPNSADSNKSELAARKTRSKKKKGKAATEAKTEPKVEEKEENGASEQSEEDAALEATTNETMERLAKLRIASLGIQQPPATHQSENDSILAALGEGAEATASERNDAEDDSAVQSVSPTRRESTSELPSISIVTQPESQNDEGSEHYDQDAPEPPSSPIATAVPKVIKSLRRDSPTKRSTSNKENVEPVEPVEPVESAEEEQVAAASISPAPATVQEPSLSESTSVDTAAAADDVQPVTSSSPTRRSEGKSGDSIEALDEMDEAVEKVNVGIANASSPDKKLSAKPSNDKGKPKKTKPAPVVRMTKAAAARLSMAQTGNKDNSSSTATARSRPSTVPGRTNSVRQSVAPAATTKPLPKPKTETVIPHSKPRPVSLSFPTPPPAAKSSKAPTKSSFQLPGEAVAAKLKAAREERLKREAAAATSKANEKAASDEKKPAFKARPVPSMLKKTPSVRHTAASRARESMMTGDAAPKPAVSSSATGLKRSNTVGSTRPRPSMAPATSTKPSQPAQLTVQKRTRPSSVHVTSSEIAAAAPRQPSSSASRPSIAPAAHSTRGTSATSKGKEVYARNAAARNAAETEKKEKEDAARKARAAAAERGRAASREWADKQKIKKMIAKMEGEAAKA